MDHDIYHDLTSLRRLAESQHGLIHLNQLGFITEDRRRRTVQSRLALERITANVFRLAGSAPTVHQRVLAAVLDAGPTPYLSHDSSAAYWGLAGYLLEPVHAMAERDQSRQRQTRLAIVHRPRKLLDSHVTILDGIPVTTPARMLFDLATNGAHPKRIERTLDTAWSMGLVNHAALSTMLADLADRGRRGIVTMRQLIDDRPPDHRPVASGLEFRFLELVRRAGLPGMTRQVNVGSGERWLGRVDFIDRARRIIVEIDSDRYHGALIDAHADAERTRALESEGWIVLRFTEVDVWHRADLVIDRLRSARDLRFRAGFAA